MLSLRKEGLLLKRLLPLLLCLCLLPGCAPKPVERTIFAMDTVMSLQVYGKNAEENVRAATAKINRLERLLSVTRPESQVWALNHADGLAIAVDDSLAELMRAAQQFHAATDGALDVTLYPVSKAWGFTTGDYQVPDEETLQDLLASVDAQAVELTTPDPADHNEDGSYRIRLPQGMELDFGAIAKGYAGEQCARLLREQGVTSALLVLGGNIQTVGTKPDGSPWQVGVQDPNGATEDTLGSVLLNDQAAVTSGGYQRFFEKDGVRYWHILDPASGKPAHSGLTSVTVIGASGTLCDALSTACFVLGRDASLDLWRECRAAGGWESWGTFDLILVGDDNTVTVTAGLDGRFSLDETSGCTLNLVEE